MEFLTYLGFWRTTLGHTGENKKMRTLRSRKRNRGGHPTDRFGASQRANMAGRGPCKLTNPAVKLSAGASAQALTVGRAQARSRAQGFYKGFLLTFVWGFFFCLLPVSRAAMRRASSSLIKSLRASQNAPRLLLSQRTPVARSPILCPKFPQSRTLETLAPVAAPLPSRQRKIREQADLEEVFESAETTEEILDAFKSVESSLAPNDKKLGLACLKVGQHLESIEFEDQEKTLEFALRALKILDRDSQNPVPIAMALHLVGAVAYSMKRFNDSLGYLTRANRILSSLEKDSSSSFDIRPVAHAIHLQLANTKTALGRREEALVNLRKCLEIKEEIFEPNSKEIGVAYRNLAEACAAILNFKEALPLCLKALKIHEEKLGSNSVEVAHDRRLLGVIYTGLEQHEKALEQNKLSLKVLKRWGVGSDLLHAEIDAANIQIALGKYDEAVETLKRVVEQTDKDSETRAMVFISMAKALCNQGKSSDARRCLELSRGILEKREEDSPSKIAEAYTEIAALYESLNEFETAISLLKVSLAMLERLPQEQHMEGNVSAKIGWLLLLTGKVEHAIGYLESAAERMKESFGPKHFSIGYIYNNLGAAYMELERPQSSAQMFALAKDVLDVALGPHHVDSIEACQSLANAYSAMGR